MKISQYILSILCAMAIGGCSKQSKDPIVSVNLTERRGTERIDTSIECSGKVLKGYYHESRDMYEKTVDSTIPSDEVSEIWAELASKPIERPWVGMDPEGDFKSIGVTWRGADSTYGVSYSYDKIPEGSPLVNVLKIIQRNGLDAWQVPEERAR